MTSSHLTPSVSKQPAPSDIEQKIAGWDSWQCADSTFAHRYVPGATFLVVRGQAKLTFKHGLELDIAEGDLVTIGEGAEAEWVISSPIETRYKYENSGATGA